MFHRFSSLADTYSIRKISDGFELVWSVSLNLCSFTHMAIVGFSDRATVQSDTILCSLGDYIIITNYSSTL